MSDNTKRIPGAVIFDMDGLMLDTERPLLSLWREAGQELGWQITEDIIYRTIGIDEPSIRKVFFDAYGQGFPYEQIKKSMKEKYLEKAGKEGIPCRPGLLTLLDHLAALKIPLGVATSTRSETARWKLGKAGIADRFSVLTFGDEVARGKPAPDIFLLAAGRLGKAPSDCIGFEDSSAGLWGLHLAGIPSVFVKDLIEPPADVLRTVWRRCADLAESVRFFG
jgi:HAD superfamily hydrolase (TIGR01509 family)